MDAFLLKVIRGRGMLREQGLKLLNRESGFSGQIIIFSAGDTGLDGMSGFCFRTGQVFIIGQVRLVEFTVILQYLQGLLRIMVL